MVKNRSRRFASLLLLMLFSLNLSTYTFAQEYKPLLLEVEGTIKQLDNFLILEGNNGKKYLLIGGDAENYLRKEVKVLGKPMLPPQNEKEKGIRFIIDVMEVKEVK